MENLLVEWKKCVLCSQVSQNPVSISLKLSCYQGMPLLAKAIGMNQAWASAWFGGTIDTTAAVVGAGSFYGDEAMKAASFYFFTFS
jgi:hypothetical protein